MVTYGSVCSGIEAASVAWEPLGWKPLWFSEIEAFPSAVLAHHWPQVPNLGDFTRIRDLVASGSVEAPDVLVGGTPCQAFSVAGLRQSLDDKRGQLSLEFVRLADAIDARRSVSGLHPAIVVWENVPGVLTTPDNAFGCFLGALAGEDVALVPPGGRWTNAGVVVGPARTIAWRILDAQYFGVAQRRRRVFVVASARGVSPEQALFEFEGVRRDSAPRREAGKGTSADVAPSPVSSGRGTARIGETRGQDPVIGFQAKQSATSKAPSFDEVSPTLDVAKAGGMSIACFKGGQGAKAGGLGLSESVAPTLSSAPSGSQLSPTLLQGAQVRRLTPTECERLQGFPDGHTLLDSRTKDGPRYRALGNSMAVPVMRWIGERIARQLDMR